MYLTYKWNVNDFFPLPVSDLFFSYKSLQYHVRPFFFLEEFVFRATKKWLESNYVVNLSNLWQIKDGKGVLNGRGFFFQNEKLTEGWSLVFEVCFAEKTLHLTWTKKSVVVTPLNVIF